MDFFRAMKEASNQQKQRDMCVETGKASHLAFHTRKKPQKENHFATKCMWLFDWSSASAKKNDERSVAR